MKHLLLTLSLLSLTSCAKAYIREWGGDQVTACGNHAAGRELLDRTAAEQCGGPATMIGGKMVDTGQAYVGYGMFQNTSDTCLVYRCSRAGPAPASAPEAK